jgi:hypothetical protein
VQFNARATSPNAVQLNWLADPTDEPQDSVTINQSGGQQPLSQSNLAFTTGATIFGGLTPNTTYKYQMIGSAQQIGGNIPTALATASATTPPMALPQPVPPHPPPHPPPPAPSQDPGAVVNVRAQTQPFGKILVSWDPAGHHFSQLVVHRLQHVPGSPDPESFVDMGPAFGGLVPSGNNFVDSNGLDVNQTYIYQIFTSLDGHTFVIARSNKVVYPPWFSLKAFLPTNVDPGQRLRPNDHPFVSVRKIMTG